MSDDMDRARKEEPRAERWLFLVVLLFPALAAGMYLEYVDRVEYLGTEIWGVAKFIWFLAIQTFVSLSVIFILGSLTLINEEGSNHETTPDHPAQK